MVVLDAGGSVETASWVDHVPALLHAYYPGSEGNTALAEILFGRTNPSGKLPFSWEKRWEDCAAYGNYPDKEHPKTNTYKEGRVSGLPLVRRQEHPTAVSLRLWAELHAVRLVGPEVHA